MVIALSVGLAGYAKYIWPKLPEHAEFVRKMAEIHKPDWGCDPRERVALHGNADAGCSSDSARRAGILFWGDSHAGQMKSALSRLADERHTPVWLRYRPSCPPAIGYMRQPPPQAELCAAFNDQVMRDLLAEPTVRTVILGGRWYAYTLESDGLAEMQAAIDRTISMIESSGRSVVIVESGVDFPWSVPECILRRGESACGRSRAQAEERRAVAQQMLANVARSHPRLRLVDPLQSLCTVDECPVSKGGEVLYSDSHHLSLAGVRAVASGILRVL
jgi:hypothetical protein